MRNLTRHPGALRVPVVLLALVAAACGGAATTRPGTSTPSSALTNTPSSALTSATSSAATSTAATNTSSPSTPAPSASATTGEVATLTTGSRGSTTYVRVDAVVEVTLTADAGYTFSAPTSSDQSVLRTISSSQTASGATAEFRAVQPGSATVSSVENPKCLPLCGLPSRLWGVTVVVTPHPVP